MQTTRRRGKVLEKCSPNFTPALPRKAGMTAIDTITYITTSYIRYTTYVIRRKRLKNKHTHTHTKLSVILRYTIRIGWRFYR